MKRFAIFLCLLLLTAPASAGAETFVPVPDEFAAALVMRADTKQVLYSFKPDKPHTAASLTKLATALAVLDLKPNWDRRVTLASADEVGGGRLRVSTGATMSVRDLFYSALAASANNAAMALGRTSSVGTKAFVSRMNAAAKRVGATHSVFYEAAGMNPKNQTTARDIALIALSAFRNPNVRLASTVGEYSFQIRNTGERKTIKSTNLPFLQDDDVWLIGGKTGYLEESKYNLVAQMRPYDGKVNDPKREVVVVVLGSPSKEASFSTVKRLAEWAWSDPELFKPAPPGGPGINRDLSEGMRHEQVKTLQVLLGRDTEVYPDGRVTGFFGPLTRAAVQAFQRKHGIAKPGVMGYGRVGPATRAKLSELYGT